MKLLFVTSQVTYSPGNYDVLIRELLPQLQRIGWEVTGVVSLKTLDTFLVKSMIGLPFMGVKKLANNLLKNSIKELLKERETTLNQLGIPHISWETMNSKKAQDFIKSNQIDLILNLRTRCIYKSETLKAPLLGCVNVHHGLLPEYRGTFCDLYALYEGRNAGFSVHKMEEKVDAGEIYRVTTVNEGSEKDYENYLKEAEKKEIEVLFSFLSEVMDKKKLPKGIPNTTTKKIYTKNPTKNLVKLFKKEGLIL